VRRAALNIIANGVQASAEREMKGSLHLALLAFLAAKKWQIKANFPVQPTRTSSAAPGRGRRDSRPHRRVDGERLDGEWCGHRGVGLHAADVVRRVRAGPGGWCTPASRTPAAFRRDAGLVLPGGRAVVALDAVAAVRRCRSAAVLRRQA
jgi:hypothetical protein